MHIAVYGGSFNPLHIGHLAILRSLAETFDKVLLVVSPKNPLKDIDSSTAEERLVKARKAVARHPELDCKVEVSDIEFSLPKPNYSYSTLQALKELHPEDELTFVMGGDQIADFRRWKNYSDILTEFGVAVFPREGYDIETVKEDLLAENPDFRIATVNAPLVTVSSSEIREGIATSKDIAHLLM